jgi:hypothetical protein
MGFLIVAYIRVSGLEMFFTRNSTSKRAQKQLLGFDSADEWFSLGRDTVYFDRGFRYFSSVSSEKWFTLPWVTHSQFISDTFQCITTIILVAL